MKNRWLLSTACGLSLLAGTATAALAQNVPSENAAAPTASGANPQVITLKPGQEAGTHTVMPEDTAGGTSTGQMGNSQMGNGQMGNGQMDSAPMANGQMGGMLHMTDAQFVQRASAGGMGEVMLGQLAMQRGQTRTERHFGHMLVTDHTKANNELTGIVQNLGMTPASGPNSMQQAIYQRLQSVPADQFDTMFNHVQVRVHRHVIALFRAEAHSGQNPQLRKFAMNTLPVLYKHLRMAEQLSPGDTSTGGMSMMNDNGGMNGNGGMSNGGMGMNGNGGGAINAPVNGNPDDSANQLNARELHSINHS